MTWLRWAALLPLALVSAVRARRDDRAVSWKRIAEAVERDRDALHEQISAVIAAHRVELQRMAEGYEAELKGACARIDLLEQDVAALRAQIQIHDHLIRADRTA